jgi:hypothetical protein
MSSLARISAVFIAATFALPIVARADGQPDADPRAHCKQPHHLLSPTPDDCLEEIFTDRPHKTDTPGIMAPGHAQAEVGVVEYGYKPHGADDVTLWNSEVKLGLSERMEVAVFYAPISSPTNLRARFSPDLAFRAKILAFAAADGAFLFTLVPYAETHRGRFTGAGGSLFLGYDFASGLELELNVGDVVSIDGGEHTVTATSAVTTPLLWGVNGFIELFSENALASNQYDGTLDFGLIYLIGRDVQVDAGVYVALYGALPLATPFLGTSFRL